MEQRLFRDRQEAGRRLAARLLPFAGQQPVVLALPRGGVVVGFEIAAALQAPLDLVLVRKIGAPFQPELAVGAVVDGTPPATVLNDDIVAQFAIPEDYIEAERTRMLMEIERRRRLYLAGRSRAAVAGHTALVVDDGIATGATMRAALQALRAAAPARLVLAVPVAPPDTLALLRAEADEVVCLAAPAPFGAIGCFYADFHQIPDAEVITLLDRAGAFAAGPDAAPPG